MVLFHDFWKLTLCEEEAGELIDVFFVCEKDGRLRMAADYIASGAMHGSLPPTRPNFARQKPSAGLSWGPAPVKERLVAAGFTSFFFLLSLSPLLMFVCFPYPISSLIDLHRGAVL